MEPVVECPPLAGGLFDLAMMRRTIRFQRVGYGRSSMADVIGILWQNGVRNVDVECFSTADDGVSVTFTEEEKLRSVQNLIFQSKEYRVVNYGKQIVGVKVHWLPVFVAESCVKAILAPYGKVLSAERLKSPLGDFRVNNGQWFVTLEIDEVQKGNLPHLFKFACGNKALLTVRGRPPLCLRCYKVGHVRNVCEGYETRHQSYHDINKSFAQVVSGNREPTQDQPEIDEEYGRIIHQRQQEASQTQRKEEERENETEDEKEDEREEESEGHQPHPTPSQVTVTPPRTSAEEESEGDGELVIDEEETGAGVRGEKRPSDESDEVQDSFDVCFPPNRPAKTSKTARRSAGSESLGVSLKNGFALLADFADSAEESDMSGQ